MKFKKITLVLIIIFKLSLINAGNILVFGSAPEYSNSEIVFKTYSDFITHTVTDIAKCKVSDTGNFSININAGQDVPLFTQLGVYKAFLYAELGKKYEVILPPKQDKSFTDLINPYFKSREIFLQIKDTSEQNLTNNIKELQIDIEKFISQHEREIVFRRLRKSKIDSFITFLNKKYSSIESSYFVNYKKYQLGKLEYLIQYTNPGKLINKYFAHQSIQYNHEAYMMLFNQVFDKFFDVFPFGKHRTNPVNIINKQRSITALRSFVSVEFPEMGDSLVDLIIIKGLYDAYYSDNYFYEALDIILDSLSSKTNINQHKLIISNIKAKENWLAKGSTAPPLNLVDADSIMVNLKDFRGKYVYLNFCTYKSTACKDEFEIMQKLYSKFNKKMEFISISIDTSFESFSSFMKANNYNWTLLSYKNRKDVIIDYRVKKYPSFYLIDPYGKIILSPALMPSENFENQFYGILNKRT